MPLEIRELIIKAQVEEGGSQLESPSASAPNPQGTYADQQLLEQCVEKVLEILQERKER